VFEMVVGALIALVGVIFGAVISSKDKKES
jgi:hypothetical protein